MVSGITLLTWLFRLEEQEPEGFTRVRGAKLESSLAQLGKLLEQWGETMTLLDCPGIQGKGARPGVSALNLGTLKMGPGTSPPLAKPVQRIGATLF